MFLIFWIIYHNFLFLRPLKWSDGKLHVVSRNQNIFGLKMTKCTYCTVSWRFFQFILYGNAIFSLGYGKKSFLFKFAFGQEKIDILYHRDRLHDNFKKLFFELTKLKFRSNGSKCKKALKANKSYTISKWNRPNMKVM